MLRLNKKYKMVNVQKKLFKCDKSKLVKVWASLEKEKYIYIKECELLALKFCFEIFLKISE